MCVMYNVGLMTLTVVKATCTACRVQSGTVFRYKLLNQTISFLVTPTNSVQPANKTSDSYINTFFPQAVCACGCSEWHNLCHRRL